MRRARLALPRSRNEGTERERAAAVNADRDSEGSSGTFASTLIMDDRNAVAADELVAAGHFFFFNSFSMTDTRH